MVEVTNALRWIVGTALIVAALIGVVADVAGRPTLDPALYAVAIAAGSATLPASESVVCRIRQRLSV